VNAFLDTLRNLGPVRLAAMGGVALALVGFFIYIMSQMSAPNMSLLYSDLNPSDGGAIVQQLEAQQIPHRASPDGTRIEVPSDQVGRLRMLMAGQGLPSGGNVGYEIFNKSETLGTTSFMQNVQQLRALEGELSRTVMTLAQVQNARIHLVLPKRELFSRQTQTATASVVLKLRPGANMGKEQVLAIQTLVAAAVPQLEPNMVSIVDERGTLLARGMGADSKEAQLASSEEKKISVEQHLTRTIEELVARTVGTGKVEARVTADLDFDRITTNSEIFDPESKVERGTQTVEEKEAETNKDAVDPVTVANNLPNNQADRTAAGSQSNKDRTENTVNYEISKTTKVHEREVGQIRRLSVAVLVDGTYANGADGQPVYTPRSDDERANIERLVKSAIGYDGVRGDTVEIVNMRFAPSEEAAGPTEDMLFGIPKQDVFRIAETVVLAIVAILVILLVIRPLVARALDRTPQLEEEPDLLAGDTGGVPQLAGPSGGALARELAMEAAQANEELEQMIDINRVDGRVRASSLRKVGEIVEKHPEEAVSIIRNWLYQES
jgi:flagellar M-ring protein FliF